MWVRYMFKMVTIIYNFRYLIFVGIWTGHHHYFDHWAREWGVGGLDMRQNMEPAWNLTGKYTTDVITERSVEVIKNHNVDKPLFLYVAHVACHSADPNDTLPAPADVVKKFSYIKDEQRRKFAGKFTITKKKYKNRLDAVI